MWKNSNIPARLRKAIKNDEKFENENPTPIVKHSTRKSTQESNQSTKKIEITVNRLCHRLYYCCHVPMTSFASTTAYPSELFLLTDWYLGRQGGCDFFLLGWIALEAQKLSLWHGDAFHDFLLQCAGCLLALHDDRSKRNSKIQIGLEIGNSQRRPSNCLSFGVCCTRKEQGRTVLCTRAFPIAIITLYSFTPIAGKVLYRL